MYEVNTTSKSYSNKSAKSVAKVAAEWKKQGLNPSAYAVKDVDGKPSVQQVEITTVSATAKALANA